MFISSIDGGIKDLKLESLAGWIHPMVEHLFEMVNNALSSNIGGSTYKGLISQNGIVITGGTAKLKEIAGVAMETLDLPAKTATAKIMPLTKYPEIADDSSFSTLIGLCKYGIENYEFAEEKTGFFSLPVKKKKKNVTKEKSSGGKSDLTNKAGSFWQNIVQTFKDIKIS